VQPDSDWDLLILIDGVVDPERETAVWHRLYPLELDVEEVLSPVVLSPQDWASPLYRAMPFHQNVERDGIVW
jgi:predicted nucleotidyltransferase